MQPVDVHVMVVKRDKNLAARQIRFAAVKGPHLYSAIFLASLPAVEDEVHDHARVEKFVDHLLAGRAEAIDDEGELIPAVAFNIHGSLPAILWLRPAWAFAD